MYFRKLCSYLGIYINIAQSNNSCNEYDIYKQGIYLKTQVVYKYASCPYRVQGRPPPHTSSVTGSPQLLSPFPNRPRSALRCVSDVLISSTNSAGRQGGQLDLLARWKAGKMDGRIGRMSEWDGPLQIFSPLRS